MYVIGKKFWKYFKIWKKYPFQNLVVFVLFLLPQWMIQYDKGLYLATIRRRNGFSLSSASCIKDNFIAQSIADAFLYYWRPTWPKLVKPKLTIQHLFVIIRKSFEIRVLSRLFFLLPSHWTNNKQSPVSESNPISSIISSAQQSHHSIIPHAYCLYILFRFVSYVGYLLKE